MKERDASLRQGLSWGLLFFIFSGALAAQETAARVHQLFVEAQKAETQGQIDIAVGKYKEILALDPKSAAAYENLGKLDFQQSHYKDAIKVLQRAVEIDPQSLLSHGLLGISLFKVGDFHGACRELQIAHRMNPKDRNIRLYLARSLVEAGDLEEGARQFQELRHEDPHSAEVIYALGQLYMKLAASMFDDLQRQAPDSYLLDLLLGDIAETQGLHPDAIEHYRKAIAKKGGNARGLHYLLGHALYKDGSYQEALGEFRRELEIDPDNYTASCESAEILLRDNPAEAVRMATQALQAKPDYAPALFVRGRALLSTDQPKDALDDLKKAAILNPNEATIHFQLARAYRQLGLNTEAQEEETIYKELQQAAHTPKPEN